MCEGVLKGEGTIDVPIRLKEGYTIQRELPRTVSVRLLIGEVVGGTNHHTLLQIRLETGRTHQIHCAFFLHRVIPLAGDDMYEWSLKWHWQTSAVLFQSVICASVTGHRIELTCPPRDDMMALVQ